MSFQETNAAGLSLVETAEIVETSEAKWFEVVFGGFSPAIRAEYGADWQEIGGAIVAFLEKIPIPAFNRVIGLGIHQPATEAIVDKVIEMYGRKNLPFGISISPVAQPTQLTDWLLERGVQTYRQWGQSNPKKTGSMAAAGSRRKRMRTPRRNQTHPIAICSGPVSNWPIYGRIEALRKAARSNQCTDPTTLYLCNIPVPGFPLMTSWLEAPLMENRA